MLRILEVGTVQPKNQAPFQGPAETSICSRLPTGRYGRLLHDLLTFQSVNFFVYFTQLKTSLHLNRTFGIFVEF